MTESNFELQSMLKGVLKLYLLFDIVRKEISECLENILKNRELTKYWKSKGIVSEGKNPE